MKVLKVGRLAFFVLVAIADLRALLYCLLFSEVRTRFLAFCAATITRLPRLLSVRLVWDTAE